MIVKIKANVGDTVFYIFHNQVCSSAVQYINVHVSNEKKEGISTEATKVEIKYKVYHSDSMSESNIYMSREELAQAILDGEA